MTRRTKGSPRPRSVTRAEARPFVAALRSRYAENASALATIDKLMMGEGVGARMKEEIDQDDQENDAHYEEESVEAVLQEEDEEEDVDQDQDDKACDDDNDREEGGKDDRVN